MKKDLTPTLETQILSKILELTSDFREKYIKAFVEYSDREYDYACSWFKFPFPELHELCGQPTREYFKLYRKYDKIASQDKNVLTLCSKTG